MKLLNIKANKKDCAVLEGINNAISKGWLKNLPDGDYYGELIGEIFNGNLHKIQGHLFVPFDYLQSKCHWRSWQKNQYPKDYKTIRQWFKDGIPSLFNQRLKLPEIKAEGLVFYHYDGRMAKLRLDMFDFHEGVNHERI